MRLAGADLAIQMTSAVFPIKMQHRGKSLIMVFIYPLARLITSALVPLTALANTVHLPTPEVAVETGRYPQCEEWGQIEALIKSIVRRNDSRCIIITLLY